MTSRSRLSTIGLIALPLLFGCASVVQSSNRSSVTRADEITNPVGNATSLYVKTHN